jgi:hypothetical protein
MNVEFDRFLNLLLEILLWVSLWGIIDNLITSFTRSGKKQIFIYILLFVFGITGIYVVNGDFIYKNTLYD